MPFSLSKQTYLGLCLSGVKKDKSQLLVLEHYHLKSNQKQNRVVISKIDSQFKGASPQEPYSDESLKAQIKHYSKAKALAVNAPLTAPPCAGCELKCPGVTKCKVPEVKWLVQAYRTKEGQVKPSSSKLATIPSPYIERPLDFYLAYQLERKFPFEPAFGPSRIGPYMRLQFLKKAFSKRLQLFEVATKVSLWRIGLYLGLRPSMMRTFFKSAHPYEPRELFLKALEPTFFIYKDDFDVLVQSKPAFEALVCALSLLYIQEGAVGKKDTQAPHLALPKF